MEDKIKLSMYVLAYAVQLQTPSGQRPGLSCLFIFDACAWFPGLLGTQQTVFVPDSSLTWSHRSLPTEISKISLELCFLLCPLYTQGSFGPLLFLKVRL